MIHPILFKFILLSLLLLNIYYFVIKVVNDLFEMVYKIPNNLTYPCYNVYQLIGIDAVDGFSFNFFKRKIILFTTL